MTDKRKIIKAQDGYQYFKNSVKKLFPDLSAQDIRPLENEIFLRLGKYMNKGYMPAAAKPKRGGNMDVVVFYVEEIKEKLNKKGGRG